MLDGTTGSLLGDFLGDSLLVHSPVEDGPADFSGVLALFEKGFGFRGVEAEDLAVSTDEETAPSGVHFAGRKGVEFYFHLCAISELSGWEFWRVGLSECSSMHPSDKHSHPSRLDTEW